MRLFNSFRLTRRIEEKPKSFPHLSNLEWCLKITVFHNTTQLTKEEAVKTTNGMHCVYIFLIQFN